MDQLTAYQILRLKPGSSVQEIREAYAKLSKEFHPEEQPEEFQRLHEAYTFLTRGARGRGRGNVNVREDYRAAEEQDNFNRKPDYCFWQQESGLLCLELRQ